MKRENLSEVGRRLKEIRKAKDLNLTTVAKKAGITAGLLSKIENFRTIPSLPVLYEIAVALDVTMADVVQGVSDKVETDFIYIKKGEGIKEEREDSADLDYLRLMSRMIRNHNVRAYNVKVNPGAKREPIANDSFELIYVIDGEIEYQLNEESIVLKQGDSLFFDGKIPHGINNQTKKVANIFKVYIMQIEDNQ